MVRTKKKAAPEPRPRGPWPTVMVVVLAGGSFGFAVIWSAVPKSGVPWLERHVLGLAMVWVAICAVVLGGCIVAAIGDRRLAASRTASAALRKATGVCVQCGERLPKWFLKNIPRGRVCLYCESGGFDPYPEPEQSEDDYVAKLKERRAAEQERVAEIQRLEGEEPVQCPVCEESVKRRATSRANVNFSKTPVRILSKPASVCFVCMEKHVEYGMPLTAGAALTWKRRENANP